MSEEILVNATPSETRVAVVENGMLQEVHLERRSQIGHLGNIYLGTVSRVLPGMQAAFLDVGLERTAFLHASDIVRPTADPSDAPENGELPPEPPINELVREGESVVVQVIKDPIGSKGARLTTNISIPSRFLVLLADTDSIGVSVRIEDEEERERLRNLVDALRDEGGWTDRGFIVRTNAEGVDAFALRADMAYLDRVLASVRERAAEAQPGTCVYTDLDLPLRVLRDMMHADVDTVRVDSADAHQELSQFAQRFLPAWQRRIERYDAARPIFDLYGVEDEIEQALRREAPLKSGGYLIIDQTEAMTTIDVNTGAFVGHRTLEETIYKTNLEAAQAIARQLRLRNLGGIIIIDFIDMQEERHREQVVATLERALARDHAKTQISGISALGLVEMTRKRTTESLGQRLTETCPVCSGRGAIKTAETVCLEVCREIMRSGRQFEASKLMVVASPAVVDAILDDAQATVAELEELIGRSIRFQREEQYAQEQFDVVLL